MNEDGGQPERPRPARSGAQRSDESWRQCAVSRRSPPMSHDIVRVPASSVIRRSRGLVSRVTVRTMGHVEEQGDRAQRCRDGPEHRRRRAEIPGLVGAQTASTTTARPRSGMPARCDTSASVAHAPAPESGSSCATPTRQSSTSPPEKSSPNTPSPPSAGTSPKEKGPGDHSPGPSLRKRCRETPNERCPETSHESWRRESNPQPPVYKTGALPLRHSSQWSRSQATGPERIPESLSPRRRRRPHRHRPRARPRAGRPQCPRCRS